jgi:hypothetical protein
MKTDINTIAKKVGYDIIPSKSERGGYHTRDIESGKTILWFPSMREAEDHLWEMSDVRDYICENIKIAHDSDAEMLAFFMANATEYNIKPYQEYSTFSTEEVEFMKKNECYMLPLGIHSREVLIEKYAKAMLEKWKLLCDLLE